MIGFILLLDYIVISDFLGRNDHASGAYRTYEISFN
jgi:hypothetical protein